MMMMMLLFSLPFSFLLSLDDDVDEYDVVAFCSQNIHRFCSTENTNIFFLLLLPLLSSMMMMVSLLSLLFSRTTS